MLAVEVVGAGDVAEVARRLRAIDHRMVVTTAPGEPGPRYRPPVALVVATSPSPVADIVLADESTLDKVAPRLRTYAARLGGAPVRSAPPALVPYDRDWPRAATRRLARLSSVFARLDGVRPCSGQHIGSTAVPGLVAKPIIDLQIQVASIPSATLLDAVLAPLGYLPATGARPDSPGVYADVPRGGEQVPETVWRKRLFTGPDPELPTILHIRQSASPFARRTVAFRDWLRANPGERDHYQQLKLDLARKYRDATDYDDYTRAKSAYFIEIEPKLDAARMR